MICPAPQLPSTGQYDTRLSIDVVRPAELNDVDLERWQALLRNGRQQKSPFLHPEFTRAVAHVRDDVEVGVLRQAEQTVGFFPFQRGAWNIGKPVGGRLSSYQGLVVANGVDWSAHELVRGCRLSAWDFDQLDLALSPFEAHARETEGAPYLDLSHGYNAYRASRRAAGSERVTKVESLGRKLEREAANVTFEFHNSDPQIVQALIEWKSAQFRETGLADVFEHGWAANLLTTILDHPTPTFSAAVSTLCTNGRPIAISYALRTEEVLHGMFIAYDREFAKYSPGLVLLLGIAREAAERGVARFQLGSGGDHYKSSVASGETRVAIGSVNCRPLVRIARGGWNLARRAAHSELLSPVASVPLKWIRPIRERLSFR